jgi:uncharacterized protein (DUF488 family)
VRTSPFSGFAPQFSRPPLSARLTTSGVEYVFAGADLGGRPAGDDFYARDGRVLYYKLAETPAFLDGLARLERIAANHRTAIMCSEEDPAGCHRHLLIARVLADRGVRIDHLRGNGTLQAYSSMPDVVKRQASQGRLFEDKDVSWRSTRSVSRNGAPRSSSAP